MSRAKWLTLTQQEWAMGDRAPFGLRTLWRLVGRWFS